MRGEVNFFGDKIFLQNYAQQNKDNGSFVDTPLPIDIIVHDVVAGGLDFFHDSRAGQFVLACDFVEFNADVFFLFVHFRDISNVVSKACSCD